MSRYSALHFTFLKPSTFYRIIHWKKSLVSFCDGRPFLACHAIPIELGPCCCWCPGRESGHGSQDMCVRVSLQRSGQHAASTGRQPLLALQTAAPEDKRTERALRLHMALRSEDSSESSLHIYSVIFVRPASVSAFRLLDEAASNPSMKHKLRDAVVSSR